MKESTQYKNLFLPQLITFSNYKIMSIISISTTFANTSKFETWLQYSTMEDGS